MATFSGNVQYEADARRPTLTYPVTHTPIGPCLIINVARFDNKRPFADRAGSVHDVAAALACFEGIGFAVEALSRGRRGRDPARGAQLARADHARPTASSCASRAAASRRARTSSAATASRSLRELVETLAASDGLRGVPLLVFAQLDDERALGGAAGAAAAARRPTPTSGARPRTRSSRTARRRRAAASARAATAPSSGRTSRAGRGERERAARPTPFSSAWASIVRNVSRLAAPPAAPPRRALRPAAARAAPHGRFRGRARPRARDAGGGGHADGRRRDLVVAARVAAMSRLMTAAAAEREGGPRRCSSSASTRPRATTRLTTLHYAAAGGHTRSRALLRRAAAAGTAGAPPARGRAGRLAADPRGRGQRYHGVIAVLLNGEANAATPAAGAGRAHAQAAAATRTSSSSRSCPRRPTRWPRCTPIAQRGDSPLHLAARHGHVNVIEYLLANGADPEAKDKQGKTPLGLTQDPPRGSRGQGEGGDRPSRRTVF